MNKLCIALLLSGCGGAARSGSVNQPASSLPSASAPRNATAAREAAGGIEERPALRRYFEQARVTGAIAWFDSVSGTTVCSDAERCRRGYVPASTFKIANTIIAFETEVVSDPETKLPWDGRAYSVAEWNRDHTLRSAIQVSCVPCFQQIARSVGAARMRDWVAKLGYGNKETTGSIDRFWLSGGLRTTPLEQIDFLRRLDAGKLPIQDRTREMVSDVITLDVSPEHVLRGKTGSAMPPDEAMQAGWFVGWVERGERHVYFATVIDGNDEGVDIRPLRRALTETILRDSAILP